MIRLLKHLRRHSTDGWHHFRTISCPTDGCHHLLRLPGPLVLSSSSKSLSSQVLRVRLSNREDAARSSAARANFSDAHAVENNGHLYTSCTLTTHNSNELAIFSITPLQHVGMVFGEKRVTLSTIPEKFPPRDRAGNGGQSAANCPFNLLPERRVSIFRA
jgi:hypothetical protein